jgi:cyclic pyranopterin phosphate synthase
MDVRSLHVPRCLLGDDHPHAWDPAAEGVRVVSPEATFDLRGSRLTGQSHVPACEGCTFESICPGIRPDYLEHRGDAEFAAARGQPPTMRGRGLAIVRN